jgi:hypothetical protein
VGPRARKVDTLIVGELRASPLPGDFCDRVAGRASYRVAGCAAPLEIHHGRMGILGEDRSDLATLFAGCRRIAIGGAVFRVPSPEDQLILQGMQGVYGRRAIRLAGVVATASAIRRGGLDWDSIIGRSRRLGTFQGLCCYLSYVEQIHARSLGGPLLPADLRTALPLQGWGRIGFTGGCYRVPGVGVHARLYLGKIRSRVRAGDWEGTSRLCLLPLAALVSICKTPGPRRHQPAAHGGRQPRGRGAT